MTCKECKARLFPENPTVTFFIRGVYHKPLCYYCPEYEEVEPPKQEEFIGKQWDVVNQLRLNQGDLRKKFAELYKQKKDTYVIE